LAKLIPLFFYLQAMWGTLIVPCVTNPANWKACSSDWDVWLYPELVRGWDLYTGQEKPYSSEMSQKRF
jgi:hypothetical protein